MLTIKDLSASHQLDREARSEILGGGNVFSSNSQIPESRARLSPRTSAGPQTARSRSGIGFRRTIMVFGGPTDGRGAALPIIL